MEPIELLKLARELRTAQKTYFRTRTTTALNACKKLEKQFDKELERYFNPSTQLCFDDFNTLPMDLFDKPLEKL